MKTPSKKPIVLLPGAGRSYPMGTALSVVFKADRDETDNRYSISEWWLEPHTEGPGAHVHDTEDCIFYVLEGTASLMVGDQWFDAPHGTFVRGPVGVPHDFTNRTDQRMGFLNVSVPGGFELEMPGIAKWFRENR